MIKLVKIFKKTWFLVKFYLLFPETGGYYACYATGIWVFCGESCWNFCYIRSSIKDFQFITLFYVANEPISLTSKYNMTYNKFIFYHFRINKEMKYLLFQIFTLWNIEAKPIYILVNKLNEQPSRVVLIKRCSESMHKFTGEHPCRIVISTLFKSRFAMGVLQ